MKRNVLKNIFFSLVAVLSLGTAFSVAKVAVDKSHERAVESKADSYELQTSDGNLIFRKYDEYNNYNWNYGNAKTAVFFANSDDNPSRTCWSTHLVEDGDKCGSGTETNVGTYTDYYVYPSDTSVQWTHVKYVRLSSSATEPTWDSSYLWYETNYIALSKSWNGYGPRYNNSKDGVYWVNASYSNLYEAGTSLYLDLSQWTGLLNEWTTGGAKLQAHFWGNNRGLGSTTVQMHAVNGFYNNEGEASESVNNALFEIAVPNSGGYAGVLFARYSSVVDKDWWNQTGDSYSYGRVTRDEPYSQDESYNKITTNNVYKIFWHDNGQPYYGLWKWDMSSYDRANKFARYVLDQTDARCTSEYYDINTASTFKAAWDELQTDGAWKSMSTSARNEFKKVTADESASYNNPKGAARYDYILRKYGTSTLTNFAGRSVASANNASPLSTLFGTNVGTNNTTIIIVITIVSLSALAGYFFIRRKTSK